MKKYISILLSLTLFILFSCKKEHEEDLTGVPQLNMKTILTGYEIIWGMDFLPNGDLIFGEKRGKLYRKNSETVTEITNDQVQSIENIFTTNGSNTWYGHYGSRIVFDKAKYLYLSAGEGGVGTYGGPYTINTNAQNLTSSWGKIHRLRDDGSIPADNPGRIIQILPE